MDSDRQLKQLLSENLPSLGAYYRDISSLLGAGVLFVNYYPSGEATQMSAKFLKPNQIARLARQMGLPNLQVEFEQHNQQNQMVVAIVTAQTKGVVTVELPSLTAQSASVQTPLPQGQTSNAPLSKRKSSSKTTRRKSSAKSTPNQQDEDNLSQIQTPEIETQVASELVLDLETAATPPVETETTAQKIPETETKTIPQAAAQTAETIPELAQHEETTAKAAKRKPESKTQHRRKSGSRTTTRCKTTSGLRAKRKK